MLSGFTDEGKPMVGTYIAGVNLQHAVVKRFGLIELFREPIGAGDLKDDFHVVRLFEQHDLEKFDRFIELPGLVGLVTQLHVSSRIARVFFENPVVEAVGITVGYLHAIDSPRRRLT